MPGEPDTRKENVLTQTWDVNAVETPLSRIPGVPLYVQIRESLRQRISGGLLEPGQKIPSEDELAARYGVSRMTVRNAISDLIDDGLLYRMHGLGTFIAHAPIHRDHTRLTDFFDDPSVQGMEVELRVLTKETIPARSRVAQALGLKEEDPVLRVDSLRIVDGEPVTMYYEYVSQRLFPTALEKELGSHPIWTILERNGIKVAYAVEKLEARLADPASARMLQIEEGTPILHKEKTVFAEDGTPLEYQECHNRGDKYTCTVILRR